KFYDPISSAQTLCTFIVSQYKYKLTEFLQIEWPHNEHGKSSSQICLLISSEKI
ncbi:hypothetical protein X975_03476, partial [Stegodyphus mimosarum]